MTQTRQSMPDFGQGFLAKVPIIVGKGATWAEDAQGTHIQSHISPSKLVYEDIVVPSQFGGGTRHAPPPLKTPVSSGVGIHLVRGAVCRGTRLNAL